MNGKKCLNLKTKGYGTKPSNLSLLGFHGLVILKMLVTSFRIRSGHMPLRAFAFLMKKVESPYCLVCDNKVEDVYHLLT
ncbi:hypothetical protein SFRURICE_007502 [Spodoptera frugiperda]|nr:hypothetical protein SFRURICE_007502 [Spodoptera frugiperda]